MEEDIVEVVESTTPQGQFTGEESQGTENQGNSTDSDSVDVENETGVGVDGELPEEGFEYVEPAFSFNVDDDGNLEIVDVERTTETIIESPSGDIHVIHEITLGDVIVTILLSCILIFMILDRVVRR